MGIVTTAKGKLYVRHMNGGRIRDDMSAVEIAELVRHAYACGRNDGQPRRGGRPTNEQRALKALLADPELLKHVLEGTPLVPLGSHPQILQQTDPDNPHGWPTWTPDEAIRATIDSMPAGSTREGYASALRIQADALGSESFDTWTGWWQWLYATYPHAPSTRQNHFSAASKLIKHGRKASVRRFIPDFKPRRLASQKSRRRSNASKSWPR